LDEFAVVFGGAAVLAAVHTLTGPDHYIPFIAMARAGHWSRARTVWVTLACGLGHLAGSAALAWLGVVLAHRVTGILHIESWRGEIAAWALILFGLLYGAWGLRRARRSKRHEHWHGHADGTVHRHTHTHLDDHAHVHADRARKLTPWILFSILVLGPCEPLVPLLMYPALRGDPLVAVGVGIVFAVVTLLTMVLVVAFGLAGLSRLRSAVLERYAHALAGMAVLACGLGVRFLAL